MGPDFLFFLLGWLDSEDEEEEDRRSKEEAEGPDEGWEDVYDDTPEDYDLPDDLP